MPLNICGYNSRSQNERAFCLLLRLTQNYQPSGHSDQIYQPGTFVAAAKLNTETQMGVSMGLKLFFLVQITMMCQMATAGEPAQGKCYIFIAPWCLGEPMAPQSRYFPDFDPLAHTNSVRCMQRATEWYNYCKDPSATNKNSSNLVVYSMFQISSPSGLLIPLIYTSSSQSGTWIYGPDQKTPSKVNNISAK